MNKFESFSKFVLPLIRSNFGPPRFNHETSHLIKECLEDSGYVVYISPYPSLDAVFNRPVSDYMGIEENTSLFETTDGLQDNRCYDRKIFLNVTKNEILLNVNGENICKVTWAGNYADLADPSIDVLDSINKILKALK